MTGRDDGDGRAPDLDAAVALAAVAAVVLLLALPLLVRDGELLGLPATVVLLFGAWAAVIGAAAWVQTREREGP